MRNVINWFEIPVSDMVRAKKFYEDVFKIQLQVMEVGNGLKMAVFPSAKGAAGGALCEHPDFYFPGHQGALIYLNANPKMELVLKRATKSGAKILIPQRQISPDHGSMAAFEDCEGNRIALHSDE